jgi:hypothetical protein
VVKPPTPTSRQRENPRFAGILGARSAGLEPAAF